MKIDANTELYCLIGHPVSKSLSPFIHNTSFEENGLNAKYMVFDVKPNDLRKAIDGIKALGIKGFNVTIPHKIEIIKYLDDISKESKLIGAVNTVKNDNGKLIGYNTDGLGFIKSLKVHDVVVKRKKVLILGAGGAAHAIAMMLAKEGANEIIILNRTEKKAKKLIEKIKNIYPNIKGRYGGLNSREINYQDVDIIINCTSIGMYPNSNQSPIKKNNLNKNMLVYDIVYKPRITKLLKDAEEKGCKVIGGLDMLLYQAILSEEIWFKQIFDINSIKLNMNKKEFL
ncbi:shikimate dehydrogenase [Caldisalinibacter kiritimatiensis]|uniref:Shikimate dehydrogenase (NADP(+)) n=1 Tax=Caldisalinibacter kiritimatiensis TaxID=1304284 RepID=R1CTV0_9FIRM|nr:shikimate dehydrogenase [Caldisalinibacter kiritimatiensis]EOD00114.1 Shikimate 5-dehydrogenase I alpha [Caldisalinibacter kiritimatiensis]